MVSALIHDLHMAFKIPHVHNFIKKKLCRQQANVIQSYEDPNVRTIGKRKAQSRKCKRLKHYQSFNADPRHRTEYKHEQPFERFKNTYGNKPLLRVGFISMQITYN
jgi:hypothetical protein